MSYVTGAFGLVSSSDGSGVTFGFSGQFGGSQDSEDGFVLMGHRYYDPGAGRFLTRDPISYNGGINLYAYTQNNPINEDDSDGLTPRFQGPRNHFPVYTKKRAYELASRACKNGGKPVLDYRDSHDNLPHYHPTDGITGKRLEKGMHYSFYPKSASLPGGRVTAEVAAAKEAAAREAAAREAALLEAEEIAEWAGPAGELVSTGLILWDYFHHPNNYKFDPAWTPTSPPTFAPHN